ncbi:MAG: lipid-A-disaccharide synthase [Aquificaceae bacterium]|nr:lipid-A-disaccharide synthase [Aquificaceae bacterium]MDW8096058.1 lipid-A-disaccharide synthase [Aquificaceae bacterium]
MKVFLSVGERSASNYVYHIFKDIAGVEFYGITDERLESIGFKSLAKIEDLSVVGIVEAVPKVPFVYGLWKRIEKMAPEMDAFILCDAPAFNLPLLKRIRKKVKKVIYFISPQVWAWKEGRAKLISRMVDHMVVILPFEVDFYKRYAREGFFVHFVGHPLIDLAKPSLEEKEVKAVAGGEKYLALLPGSRWSEIKRHAPYLVKVLECLKPKLPVLIPTFESFRDYLQAQFNGFPVKLLTTKDMENPSYNLMAYAELTLLASGTAELEASLLGAPHLVFYRVNPITYLIGRLLVKVKHVALTNLILQREVIPELVQKSPEELCRLAKRFEENPELKKEMEKSFKELREILGGEGAIQRLRELFLKLLYQ